MAKGKVVHGTDGCIVLVEGNIKKRREPSTHVIKFPGGYIEVARTSNDEYWAHIRINQGQVMPEDDQDSFLNRRGEIVESRMTINRPIGPPYARDIAPRGDMKNCDHIAVRIRMSNE